MAHEPEVKAQAMAALLTGQGVGAVAEEYALPVSTVSDWNKGKEQWASKPDIGRLLVGYLQENLTTLMAQAVAFRDPAWLREQDASQVGVLHGILTDKAVRILEAMEPPGGNDSFVPAPVTARQNGGRT